MVVILASRLSNDIPYRSTTNCINLPRCIPLDRMNYKDALTHPINTKLTKAQLVEISKRLQVECLANELDKPELIPLNSYIKDAQSRMDIHHYEMRELNKDVRNVFNYIKDKYNLIGTLIAAK